MSEMRKEESQLREEQKSEQAKENTLGFTKKVRIVLQLAQEEAMHRQLYYIDTEHLLLGLINEIEGVVPQTSPDGPVHDGEDVADRIFCNLGVKTQQIRTELEQRINHGKIIKPKKIGLTPGAKKVIELTVYETRNLGYQYIGTGHLVLGLLREKKGKAAVTLKRLGIDLKKARAQLVQMLPISSSSPKRNRDR